MKLGHAVALSSVCAWLMPVGIFLLTRRWTDTLVPSLCAVLISAPAIYLYRVVEKSMVNDVIFRVVERPCRVAASVCAIVSAVVGVFLLLQYLEHREQFGSVGHEDWVVLVEITAFLMLLLAIPAYLRQTVVVRMVSGFMGTGVATRTGGMIEVDQVRRVRSYRSRSSGLFAYFIDVIGARGGTILTLEERGVDGQWSVAMVVFGAAVKLGGSEPFDPIEETLQKIVVVEPRSGVVVVDFLALFPRRRTLVASPEALVKCESGSVFRVVRIRDRRAFVVRESVV